MESFENNEKLVYKVYNKQFVRYGHIKEDLLQCGRMALWRACQRFDETKGYKFSTYAVRAITNEMLDFVYQELKHYQNTGCEYNDNLVADSDYLIEIMAIQDACSKCKHKERWYKIMQGYTMKEIAEQEHRTKQAISKCLVKDKKIIKESLADA